MVHDLRIPIDKQNAFDDFVINGTMFDFSCLGKSKCPKNPDILIITVECGPQSLVDCQNHLGLKD